MRAAVELLLSPPTAEELSSGDGPERHIKGQQQHLLLLLLQLMGSK